MIYHWIRRLTRHSVKSSILVSASGHQSNTSSMKGIPAIADGLPASAILADRGGPGAIGFTKARMTINKSWTHAPLISANHTFGQYYVLFQQRRELDTIKVRCDWCYRCTSNTLYMNGFRQLWYVLCSY